MTHRQHNQYIVNGIMAVVALFAIAWFVYEWSQPEIRLFNIAPLMVFAGWVFMWAITHIKNVGSVE